MASAPSIEKFICVQVQQETKDMIISRPPPIKIPDFDVDGEVLTPTIAYTNAYENDLSIELINYSQFPKIMTAPIKKILRKICEEDSRCEKETYPLYPPLRRQRTVSPSDLKSGLRIEVKVEPVEPIDSVKLEDWNDFYNASGYNGYSCSILDV
jgi:hypothetical protein